MSTVATGGPAPFVTGLGLAECPRWYDGWLWVSDMWGHAVHRYRPDGTGEQVASFPDDEPGGLGWLLTDARPPAGAPRAQRLYYAYCAECHGVHGRGSWRASLFLLRPSDLTDPRVAAQSDRYLFDIIKHGGATIGRPGMPAFGAQLSDEDIQLLVGYMRALASRRAARSLTARARSRRG